MHYAITSDDRSAEELAARVFGTDPDDPITKRAAKSLVRENSLLRRIDELPPTLVVVPRVRGAEPNIPTPPLPAAAAGLLIHTALERAGEIRVAAKRVAEEGIADANSHRKELQYPDLKRRAREDRRFAKWLHDEQVDAKAETAQARELAAEYTRAIAELNEDLEALMEVLEGPQAVRE